MTEDRKSEISLREAARYIGVSHMTMIRRVRAGTIRARREGRFLRFLKRDLDAYLNSTVINPDKGANTPSEEE